MPQSWDYIAKIVVIGDSGTGKSSLTMRLCEGRFSPYHDVTIGVEFGSRIVPVGPPASLALGINSPSTETTTNPSSSTPPDQSTDADPASPPSQASTKAKAKAAAPAPSKPPKQKYMKLSLWDTAGQEAYNSITRSYFRGASGALLVYDITRRSTFESATSWLRDLQHIADENIVVVLVGNKSDLASASTAIASTPTNTTTTTTTSPPSSSSSPPSQEQQQPPSDEAPPPPSSTPPSSSAPTTNRAIDPHEARTWCSTNHILQHVETSAKSGAGVERAFQEVAERIFQNIEAGKYDLNDRRSGVKASGSAGGAGDSARNTNTARTVNLGMNDVAAAGGSSGGGGSGWAGVGAAGGCC
ncbi:MAG: hypothetical protein M1819_005175 [Sarea resinae]|nr:MAG: hypothetical protein M1819_005175 [Sarea resinae]